MKGERAYRHDPRASGESNGSPFTHSSLKMDNHSIGLTAQPMVAIMLALNDILLGAWLRRLGMGRRGRPARDDAPVGEAGGVVHPDPPLPCRPLATAADAVCDHCGVPFVGGLFRLTLAYRPLPEPEGVEPISAAAFHLCPGCAEHALRWLAPDPASR